MGDPERDILDLIRAGRRIEAIKLVREHLGLGLAEAKAFVEGLQADLKAGSSPGDDAFEPSDPGVGPPGTPPRLSVPRPAGDLFDHELDSLLRAKKKIDAVKLYRRRAGGDLKDAKDAIELRAVELGLQARPSKCFIATAACGGGEQAEVATLRRFRNRVLRRSRAGRVGIALYEAVSPPIATAVGRSEPLAAVVRAGVRALARACEEGR